MHPNIKRVIQVLIISALAVGMASLPLEGLTLASRLALGIFIMAAGLWVTEVIPPFATSIMVVVLHVYLLGAPGGPLGLDQTGVQDSYQIFLNPIASPILVLFFGGFILAIAATKHGLDQRMAKAFLKPFGHRPSMIMLGVILITATFSMFMSNTATTAMMIAILAPFFRGASELSNFSKALVLSVPFAANIGGMGTVIGTPPNAVAASILGQMGYPVTFLHWMSIGVPIVVLLLAVLWLSLLRFGRPLPDRIELPFKTGLDVTWRLVVVSVIFGLTVVLWMTEVLHGIPSAVVALLPVMIFALLGIIGPEDLKKIDWDVLILIVGGLTLGVGMQKTGLSQWMVELVPFEALPLVILVVLISVVTVIISNFMSNTAAANLIIPIAAAIAVWSPVMGCLVVAFSASLAMSLPVSTPPNAIAYATKCVNTRDMAVPGTVISAIGLVFVMVALLLLMRTPLIMSG